MDVTFLVFDDNDQTSRIAGVLSSVWNNVHYTKIDISGETYDYSNLEFSDNEVCYLIFPSYDGRVPQKVMERLSEMKAHDTPMAIVAVDSALISENAILEMINTTATMGFHPIAAINASVPRATYFKFVTKYLERNSFKELEEFAMQIRAEVKAKLLMERDENCKHEKMLSAAYLRKISNSSNRSKPRNVLYI